MLQRLHCSMLPQGRAELQRVCAPSWSYCFYHWRREGLKKWIRKTHPCLIWKNFVSALKAAALQRHAKHLPHRPSVCRWPNRALKFRSCCFHTPHTKKEDHYYYQLSNFLLLNVASDVIAGILKQVIYHTSNQSHQSTGTRSTNATTQLCSLAAEAVNPTQIRRHECVAGKLKPSSLLGIISIYRAWLIKFCIKIDTTIILMWQSFEWTKRCFVFMAPLSKTDPQQAICGNLSDGTAGLIVKSPWISSFIYLKCHC